MRSHRKVHRFNQNKTATFEKKLLQLYLHLYIVYNLYLHKITVESRLSAQFGKEVHTNSQKHE